MNITDMLEIQRKMCSCLHCGKLTREDEPFCSDKCKSDDYLQSEATCQKK